MQNFEGESPEEARNTPHDDSEILGRLAAWIGARRHPMEFQHVPVLLQEVLDGLAIRPDGIYVD